MKNGCVLCGSQAHPSDQHQLELALLEEAPKGAELGLLPWSGKAPRDLTKAAAMFRFGPPPAPGLRED